MAKFRSFPTFLVFVLVCIHAVLTNGYIRLPVTERTKTLKEYLIHVKAEVDSQHIARGLYGELEGKDPPYHVGVANMTSHFFSNVSVGTPHQEFTVVLRTDTTGIWVPSVQCPATVYQICRDHKQYDSSKSSSFVKNGQMFGYGGMVGQVNYDRFTIGRASVTHQAFAEAFSYNYNDTSMPYDGLLGLDLVQKIFSNDESLFMNMVDQYVIGESEMVYGIYFRKTSTDPDDSGALIIGGRDESLYHGNLTYVNGTNEYMWKFVIDNVVLQDMPNIPPLCPNGCTAVPNTGSHFISASKADLDILHQNLGAVYFSRDLTYLFNCSALDKIPAVYISVGATPFKLPWQSFVDIIVGPTGDVICVSSFVAYDSDVSGGSWSVGDAFFTSLYVEFDPGNNRIGFAQSIYSF